MKSTGTLAAIMQPTYLPWIGYFDMIDCVDKFVFLDDAQVLKRYWDVRNRVLTQNGETYLTVPLSGHKHGSGSNFVETRIDLNQQWAKAHLATIRHAYGKTPHFAEVFADLEKVLLAEHTTIGQLNEDFISTVARQIGITTSFLQSSQLRGVEGRKDERLVSICREIGADTYLAARGSSIYIESEREGGAFHGTGISIFYQNYAHPTYPQRTAGFESHMSVVDLLMNCGYADALSIIRSGRGQMMSSNEIRVADQLSS